jgi:hypothetical protein
MEGQRDSIFFFPRRTEMVGVRSDGFLPRHCRVRGRRRRRHARGGCGAQRRGLKVTQTPCAPSRRAVQCMQAAARVAVTVTVTVRVPPGRRFKFKFQGPQGRALLPVAAASRRLPRLRKGIL